MNPSADSNHKPTTIKITAPELCSAYRANEVAADIKYKGKIIKVTGVIDSIGRDAFRTAYFTLTSGGKYGLKTVWCTFNLKDEPQLAQLTRGQKVTVQGKCEGEQTYIRMGDCILTR